MENHHKSTDMPFPIGHRMCISKDCTLMEGQVALVRIMQRNSLINTSATPAERQFSLPLRPKGGLKVKL
jgi:cytochrome P450